MKSKYASLIARHVARQSALIGASRPPAPIPTAMTPTRPPARASSPTGAQGHRRQPCQHLTGFLSASDFPLAICRTSRPPLIVRTCWTFRSAQHGAVILQPWRVGPAPRIHAATATLCAFASPSDRARRRSIPRRQTFRCPGSSPCKSPASISCLIEDRQVPRPWNTGSRQAWPCSIASRSQHPP